MATEDHQEEELKAAAANNDNGGLLDDGCCEEAADCELLPKSAATDSQESDFGSLLGKRGKRNQTEQIKDSPENWAELEGEDDNILLVKKKTASKPLSEILIKKREQKTENKVPCKTFGGEMGKVGS